MAKKQPIEIFMPPNMLKAKLGGNGVRLDMGAIKRAEAAMETLKAEFTDWMNADVAKLGACRDAFAARPGSETSGHLYRASHDVKGQALTFEYPFAARVASSLCKLLDAPQAAVPLGLVDAHVDAIRVIVRKNIKNDTDRTTSLVTQELEARVTEVLETVSP